MHNNELNNNLVKMFNANKDYANNEISRLGSFDQKDPSYRRNGMMNFGARQMMAMSSLDFYIVGGSGGSPIVGS